MKTPDLSSFFCSLFLHITLPLSPLFVLRHFILISYRSLTFLWLPVFSLSILFLHYFFAPSCVIFLITVLYFILLFASLIFIYTLTSILLLYLQSFFFPLTSPLYFPPLYSNSYNSCLSSCVLTHSEIYTLNFEPR